MVTLTMNRKERARMTVMKGDVLSSAKLGGAFPSASFSDPMNAAAAVPETVAVGVVTALGLIGFSAVGAWKRNRDGGR
jgi:hypothetical protein